MKKIILSIVMVLVMAVSAFAADYVIVTGTDVRLRMQPSLKSETLTTSKGVNIHPKKGEKLECLGQSGDFYKVRYQNKVVFISKKFSRPESAKKKSSYNKNSTRQQHVVVTGTGVRLRLQPSLKAKTLQRGGVNVHPAKGERIKLMGVEGDFYKVNYQGNYVYIHMDYAHPE